MHNNYPHACTYMCRDIYSMYMDMHGATFTGKQMSNLQKVKDFYNDQVSLLYTQHSTEPVHCWQRFQPWDSQASRMHFA